MLLVGCLTAKLFLGTRRVALRGQAVTTVWLILKAKAFGGFVSVWLSNGLTPWSAPSLQAVSGPKAGTIVTTEKPRGQAAPSSMRT